MVSKFKLLPLLGVLYSGYSHASSYHISSVSDDLLLNNKPATNIQLCEDGTKNCISILLNDLSMHQLQEKALKNYKGNNKDFTVTAKLDGFDYKISDTNESGSVLKIDNLNNDKGIITLTFLSQLFTENDIDNPYIKVSKTTFSSDNKLLLKKIRNALYAKRLDDSITSINQVIKSKFINSYECKISNEILADNENILNLLNTYNINLTSSLSSERLTQWQNEIGNPRLKLQSEKYFDKTQINKNSLSNEVYDLSRLMVTSSIMDSIKFSKSNNIKFMYELKESLSLFVEIQKITNESCNKILNT